MLMRFVRIFSWWSWKWSITNVQWKLYSEFCLNYASPSVGLSVCLSLSLSFARFLNPGVTLKSRVTPGLRENIVFESANPGVNSVTRPKLTRRHRKSRTSSDATDLAVSVKASSSVSLQFGLAQFSL